MSNYYLCSAYIVTDGPHILAGLVRRVFLQLLPTFLMHILSKDFLADFEIIFAQVDTPCYIVESMMSLVIVATVDGLPVRIGEMAKGVPLVKIKPGPLLDFGRECQRYLAGLRETSPVLHYRQLDQHTYATHIS